MSGSILDFDRDDRDQYFYGCTVGFIRGGRRMVGTITGFSRGNVTLDTGRACLSVPLGDIEWSGTRPAKWLSYNDGLVYVGSHGTRTVKKGATTRNLFGLYFSPLDTRVHVMADGGQAGFPTGLVRAYLDDLDDYPTTAREAFDTWLQYSRVILDDHTAVLLNQQSGKTLHLWRGTVKADTTSVASILTNHFGGGL